MTPVNNLRIGIVVPTYNESANIVNLLTQILVVKEKNNYDLKVLVVDDNSPDKTGDIAENFAIQNADKIKIKLLRRSGKLGLSSAYKQGFATLVGNCDCLVSMDADLSHNPIYLENFVENFEKGYELVIGSRYVDGGGVKGWGAVRAFISRFGSIYCNILLGIMIKDFTGGYNMYSTKMLINLDYNKINAEGYLFQIQMKYNLIKKFNVKYIETPIIFNDREAGKSKFSKKIVIEAFTGVLKLALKR